MVKKVAAKKVEIKSDRFNWRSLYLYAICFITLLVCLFSLVAVIKGLVAFIYPDLSYIDPYRMTGNEKPEVDSATVLANQLEQAHRYAVRRIIDSLTMFIIAALLYLFHWRQIQADRK